MKKIFLIIFLNVFLLSNVCIASNWIEILEKKYIDADTISINNMGYVSFWIKALRKQDEELALIGKNFWYSLDKHTIDCKYKKISSEVIMIYDLKEKLIFSDELPSYQWHSIAPDTYADAYYNLFCLVPFEENPLTKNKI